MTWGDVSLEAWWPLALVCGIAVAVGVVVAWRRFGRKVGLLVTGLLSWLACWPVLWEEGARTRQPVLLVVRDQSESVTETGLDDAFSAQFDQFGDNAFSDLTKEGWAVREVVIGSDPKEAELALELEKATGEVGERLAGVVLASDGRETGPEKFLPAARALGAKRVGVFPLLPTISLPTDLGLADVRVGEWFFEGDEVRVSGMVRSIGRVFDDEVEVLVVDQAEKVLGKAMVRLRGRTETPFEVWFSPPKEGGRFEVRLQAPEDDAFPQNNRWPFAVMPTERKLELLLADHGPRWEFRYLKNVFDGRDPAVRLAWWLVKPDRVLGQQLALPAARVGQGQSGGLPLTREDWAEFDAAILGDLGVVDVSVETWRDLEAAVREEGLFLILIAGQERMPREHLAPAAERLSPVELGGKVGDASAFSPRLAATAWGHPLVKSGALDWVEKSPQMRWRAALGVPKPGAEVLLEAGDDGAPLLVTTNQGRGKVALVLSDRFWRMRQGRGDGPYQDFWRGLLEWGVGPRLQRSLEGGQVGVEQVWHEPGDPVVARTQGSPGTVEVSLDGESWTQLREERTINLPTENMEGRQNVTFRIAQAETSVSVWIESRRQQREFEKLGLDEKKLNQLAKASQGALLQGANAGDTLRQRLSQQRRSGFWLKKRLLPEGPWVGLVALAGLAWLWWREERGENRV